MKEQLAQSLFDHIPVGVGSKGIIPTSAAALEAALGMGMDWCAAGGQLWLARETLRAPGARRCSCP